ncbi:MAG TPA: hypothetical protein VD969_03370 [Symbiobacteriaceae bacterium]|nr:hypothetical protein [Symbiobacteriaceae bacterium]
MNLLHITDDFAAIVAAQVKAGKTLHQIARDMHISIEMAASALSKWSRIHRTATTAHSS